MAMAKKSNSEWWAKRQEEKYLAGEKSVDKYYKDLVSSLEEAQAEIQDTLDTFYARYMSENRLSNYAEAQKLLNKTELKGLKDFIERAQKSLGVYDRELNNISLKARITRYDALKARVDTILQKVYAIDYEEMSIQELKKIYEDTYYKTIYRLDQKRGCHCEFTKLNANAFNEVITYPFNGADFSSRLWKQKDHLLQQLNESITTMLVQGRSPGTLSKDFAKKFKTKKHEAYRLLHTEASYVMEQANQKAYDEDGVEEYEWIATLDSSTCEVCAPKDGEVYKVGKGIACDTLPPAHCFCRCTTAPYFDDDYEEDEERFARDEDGKPIQVPGDMTYPEWHKKYVESNPVGTANEKKERNKHSDKKQYEEYKNTLGNKAPKTFAEFQDMKYTNNIEWEAKKREYLTVSKIKNKESYSDVYRQKVLDTYYEFRMHGYELTDHSIGRILGQKTGKGKRIFTNDELIKLLRNKPNYIDEKERMVKFYDGIAIIQNRETKEIVTIVTRENKKQGWGEYEENIT